MKKVLSTLIIISLLAVPIATTASDAGNACAQAQMAAKQDANGTLWFFLGCLGTVIAVALGYTLEPSPSATTLLGKSPEYVAVYTDCYKKEVKKTRGQNALFGCLVTGGVYGCLYGLYVVLLAATI